MTDGAATALFRNIRMPLGEGVLGAVATGEAPSQSADYLADQTKSHLEASDAAVAAEGVKAIMGVPLRAEGKVIGALPVADRHAHKSMGYQFGSVLAGGIAPLVAVALLNAGNGEPGWVILYFSVIGVITVASAILAPETMKRVRGNLEAAQEAAQRQDSAAAAKVTVR